MINVNLEGFISGQEIHKTIESKNKRYDIWVSRVIKYADLQEGIDFRTKVYKSTGGRPFTDYEFTINAAKEICLLERNEKGKDLRRWLIGLSNKVDNSSLLTHEQIIEVIRMVKVFAIYEHRMMAREKNKENYLANSLLLNPSKAKNKGLIFAEFNIWRNKVLSTGKEQLNKRLMEYCLVNGHPNKKNLSQDDVLTLMGEYESIKNAVWDILVSKNKSEELAMNLASLAQEVAKEIQPFMQRLNENNLFFQKIENEEVQKVLN